MKYLDERITIYLYGFTITESKTYTYAVLANNTVIYYGSVFLPQGERGHNFDITDIVSNYAYINTRLSDDLPNNDIKMNFQVRLWVSDTSYKTSITETVYLAYRYPHNLTRLEMDTTATQYNNLQGGLVPVYPNVVSWNTFIPMFFTINDSSISNKIGYLQYKKGDYSKSFTYNLSNGLNNTYFDIGEFTDNESDNIERSEMISNEVVGAFGPYEGEIWWDGNSFNYWHVERVDFKVGYIDVDDNWVELREVTPSYTSTGYYAVATEDNPNIKHIQFRIESPWGDTVINLEDINLKGNCIIYFTTACISPENNEFSVSDIRYWTVAPSEEGVTLKILDTNYPGSPKILKLADLDDCTKGYYLMWQDRMGGIQSQHFSANNKYSETFEHTTITNYRGEKHKVGVEVSPKFEINSGWIDESKYPNYESIFISPYLKLYDIQEDTTYNVVVTDTQYDEKTFHNQGRKLFNLQLSLEKNTKQNITY